MALRDLSFLAAVLLVPAGLWAQGRIQNPAATPPPGPVKVEAPSANPNAADIVGGSGLAVDTKSYVIGPEDILYVKVWREAEFTSQYGVRPDGKISLPLIKDVQAAGLTPDKLGENLTQQLSEYLNKPEIVVSVLQVNSKKFSITGEVNRPGQYPLVIPITIFDALSAAGGFHEFANRKKILVIRGSGRLHFNYDEYVKGKGSNKGKKGSGNDNFIIENNDTIVVN